MKLRTLKEIKDANLFESILKIKVIRSMLMWSTGVAFVFTVAMFWSATDALKMLCAAGNELVCYSSFLVSAAIMFAGVATLIFLGLSLGMMVVEIFVLWRSDSADEVKAET